MKIHVDISHLWKLIQALYSSIYKFTKTYQGSSSMFVHKVTAVIVMQLSHFWSFLQRRSGLDF